MNSGQNARRGHDALAILVDAIAEAVVEKLQLPTRTTAPELLDAAGYAATGGDGRAFPRLRREFEREHPEHVVIDGRAKRVRREPFLQWLAERPKPKRQAPRPKRAGEKAPSNDALLASAGLRLVGGGR